ncbi:glutathione S-transferase [Psychromonas ossibalaenae]|uniref:glutathione S-transferase n=1 Tax=Psychromonas ossibalaenae TaxID=444922 RepID=UPI00068502FA|nr:glutathione S-transferase [Psychromonas ossibalaenae]
MLEQTHSYPILYSLRHCPYAMRARIAIFKSGRQVRLRDIKLADKPAEMLRASPKGTVPVLVVNENLVIEESLEVMLWVLAENDPDDLLQSDTPQAVINMLQIINHFDQEFKACLEAYRCAKRYHQANLVQCRETCEVFLQILEQALTEHRHLFSEQESLLDIALISYLRQFAQVERQWYLQAPYPKLRAWLNSYLQSPLFTKIMAKQPMWLDSRQDIYFPDK